MFAKKSAILLTALAAALFSSAVCYAEGEAVLSQSYAWEEKMDVFIAGDMDLDKLNCKVSNQNTEIIDSGILADKGVSVYTTVLLDISASMPPAVQGNVKSYIDTLIKNISKNEQYKIITFGEGINVLQDFTGDRYDLANAVKQIEFSDQKSMIYDAVYNTIPKIQPQGGAPCYYRTIVITDGIDDTASGITKEELYIKLQNETYPIHVAAVTGEAQAEPEKELAALVRMSGGKYVNLTPESDLEMLSSSFEVNDMIWIRAAVPKTLSDGSVRQIDISDGLHSVQFDLKIPVSQAPVTEASAPKEDPIPEASVPEESFGPAAAPDISGQTEAPASDTAGSVSKGLFGEYTSAAVIGIVIGIIIFVSCVIAFVMIKSRHRQKINKLPDDGSPAASNKTEILGAGYDEAGNGSSAVGSLCVRLRNIKNPDQVWNVSLSDAVIIGRDTGCRVCLDDSSVSRSQCRLYLADGIPMAENLSKTNITRLNDSALNSPLPIKEGDRMKCGRITIMVDSVYHSNSDNDGNLNKMTGFVNV